MKDKKCNVCGQYSGKRKTCLECKTKYPFKPSAKNNDPFNRKLIHNDPKLFKKTYKKPAKVKK